MSINKTKNNLLLVNLLQEFKQFSQTIEGIIQEIIGQSTESGREQWLSAGKFAKEAGVCVKTLRNWRKSGRLKEGVHWKYAYIGPRKPSYRYLSDSWKALPAPDLDIQDNTPKRGKQRRRQVGFY